jgi:two-component system, OmpR family, phosphate regulon sensor histidine kinase PhoR
MSHRRKFLASAFVALALASFIALSLSYPETAIVAFCAALVGALLHRITFSQNNTSELEPQGLVPLKDAYTSPRSDWEPVKMVSPRMLLDATMNGMREGLLVVDETMRVVVSNRAMHEIFSHVDGPLEGKRLSELTRNPTILRTFYTAFKKSENTEAKVEMRAGDRFAYDLRVVPLHLEDEESTRGAIGVFFDITRLERLERVRQEFLSNVSHELRTPLTAILAFIETLEDVTPVDLDDNHRFLSVIRRNTERMHNLINDILELSAIEAGNVRVQPKAVDLHILVDDVITSLSAKAEGRNVNLRNEVASGAFVFADPHRLEQMVTNLVDNGIKFNREGGFVSIRHEKNSRDRIIIADSGDGISEAHIKRIFERFYRVDRARSREMGGTGLGLAIVKHLARAHGGELTVESSLGEGSIFTIELLANSESDLVSMSDLKDKEIVRH